MTIEEFKKRLDSPLRQSTLLFLIKDKKILLAMKKRGFGKGHWNGVGGKPEEHVYKCSEWEGQPSETEEMKPKWFDIDNIPYDEMWDDDKMWLPEVLGGTFVEADFMFDASGKVVEYKIY